MTPALLLPAGLAAMAALAVPLLLHIARASEARPTDFAALRWLREKPRPRHRLRFDEWLLLATRLLLLALVAVWLARPVLEGQGAGRPWVVVLPGIDPQTARGTVAGKAELRWLAPGFPKLDRPAPQATASIGSLLREADAILPAGAALTVLARSVIGNADAERPRLSRPVTWRVLPGQTSLPAAAKPTPIHIALRFAPGVTGLRYARAAARALAPDADIAPIGKPLPGSGALLWFAPGPFPTEVRRWAEAGGTVLAASEIQFASGDPAAIVLRDRLGQPLVERATIGKGRLLRFTQPLVPEHVPELLDPDFAARLGDLLRPALPAPSRVAAADYAPQRGGLPPAHSATEVQPWLALLIAAVILVERWLATSRRRAASP